MKLTNKKICGIALAAAMSLTCAAGGGALIANADTATFNPGNLANRAWIGGVTEEKVAAAFEKGATRLKTAMGDSVGDFQIVNDPLGNGWPAPSNPANHFVAAHLDLGTYSGWNMWGHGGYAFMVYNPHLDDAYTVRGNFAVAFTNMNNGWQDQSLYTGYPVGEDFQADGHNYQNFGNGYAKEDGTFVTGKKMGTDGVEADLTADDVVKGLNLPVYADIGSAGLFTRLTVADMDKAFTDYYAEKELDFGTAFADLTLQNSIWRQNVTGGGNLVYNSLTKQMFTVKTFLTAYNATTEWGNPVSDEAVDGTTVYQQFDSGVVVKQGEGDPTFHTASHYDPEKHEVVADYGDSLIGTLSGADAAKLPQSVTPAAIKEAIGAVHTEAMGEPKGYAVFETDPLGAENTDFVKQLFTEGEGETAKTTVLYVDVTKTPLKAVTLTAEAYADYATPARFNGSLSRYPVTGEMVLGPATGDAFTAGEKQYQNFLYGAMELTAKQPDGRVLPGVNYGADGKRTVLDLSSFIKIDADAIKIPTRYNVGAADLLKAFKTAYKAYADNGVAVGMPNKEGIGVWFVTNGGQEPGTNEFTDENGEVTGRGMIKLGLHMTDSSAMNFYGVTAMLAYSPKDGKVYIMKDAEISAMATYYCAYGAPTSELTETTITTEDGEEATVQIQNFELGYLVVMGDTATMMPDKNWDFDLRGAVNLDGSKIPGTTYPGEQSGGNTPGGNTPGGTTPGGDTPAPGTDDGSDGGCGSVVGSGFALLAVVAAASVVLLARKRKE